MRCTTLLSLATLAATCATAWADEPDDADATHFFDDVREVAHVDAPAPAPAPRLVSKPAVHNELYFRAGMAFVDPRITSSGLQLETSALASIAAGAPPQGGIATTQSNIYAGIIGFAPAAFGGHVAFETIVGIPQKTKFLATGDLATMSLAPSALGVPTGIKPLGSELGEAETVPPMLTAVARLPSLGPITPYAGIGASVLFVTNAKITNAVLTEVATPKLEVSPVAGFVAQAGLDIHLSGRFFARLDVKELWFQTSETTISNIRVHTTIPLLETVNVGSAKTEVTANPILFQAGLGANF